MEYEKLYEKIIAKAKSENRKKGEGIYYEEHHIKPRSIFPELINDPDNKVLLTAREHYFCHQLLTKIYAEGEAHKKMISALWFLTHDKQNKTKISSREYERLREEHAKLLSEDMKGNTYGFQKGKASPMKGKKTGKHPWNYGLKMKTPEEYAETKERAKERDKARRYKTPEQRAQIEKERIEKISKTMKGVKKSEKTIEKMRNAKREQARKSSKSIRCINTGEIFECLQDICEKYPFLGKNHIRACCLGQRRSTGTLNGEKMKWEYVE